MGEYMKTIEAINMRNELLGAALVKAFTARHFDARFCRTKEEALKAGLALIPDDDTVGWGGSMTLDELGIKDALRERGTAVFDRDTARSPDEREELIHKCLSAGTFLMSANAISETGCLVNIDGMGNRVAALCWGPRQVIVFAGLNKVGQTLRDAVVRCRTIACPRNVVRLTPDAKTPCAKTGCCGNCQSADSLSSQVVVTRLCKPAGRIKVILIGEDCGL
jgi:L-lactate utilization protein LutB